MTTTRADISYRTYHNVEIGVVDWTAEDGSRGLVLVFPDGKTRVVRSAAYANLEEACAAEVAVWRLRRISRGIDKPAPAAGAPSMPQEHDPFAGVDFEEDAWNLGHTAHVDVPIATCVLPKREEMN